MVFNRLAVCIVNDHIVGSQCEFKEIRGTGDMLFVLKRVKESAESRAKSYM